MQNKKREDIYTLEDVLHAMKQTTRCRIYEKCSKNGDMDALIYLMDCEKYLDAFLSSGDATEMQKIDALAVYRNEMKQEEWANVRGVGTTAVNNQSSIFRDKLSRFLEKEQAERDPKGGASA